MWFALVCVFPSSIVFFISSSLSSHQFPISHPSVKETWCVSRNLNHLRGWKGRCRQNTTSMGSIFLPRAWRPSRRWFCPYFFLFSVFIFSFFILFYFHSTKYWQKINNSHTGGFWPHAISSWSHTPHHQPQFKTFFNLSLSLSLSLSLCSIVFPYFLYIRSFIILYVCVLFVLPSRPFCRTIKN
jgi:hypothetical protein